MTLDNLKDIISGLNLRLFESVLDKHETLVDETRTHGSMILVPPYKQLPPIGLWSGVVNGKPACSSVWAKQCLDLKSTGERVLVGHIIDAIHQQQNEDRTIILLVGINYGQTAKYLKHAVPLVDHTGMRKRLQHAFLSLKSENPCVVDSWYQQVTVSDHHLVAANLLPWITSKSWSHYKFNSAVEEAVVNTLHPLSPIENIVLLIQALHKHIKCIVFHGTNCLATSLSDAILDAAQYTGPAIMCDNLAYGKGIQTCVARRFTQTPGSIEDMEE